MRTTVTLDDDVAAGLRRLARARDVSFKEALNTAVREGLRSGQPPARPFQVTARPLGLRPDVDMTKALQVAAGLEDEERVRKLERRA